MAMNWLSMVASRWMNPQPLYGLKPAQGIAPIGRLYQARTTDLYRILRVYYLNNSLYDMIADVLRRQSVWHEGMKGIRNPAYRVVEFHAGHLWPGTLPAAL